MYFDNSQHAFYKIDKIIFRAYFVRIVELKGKPVVAVLAVRYSLPEAYAKFVTCMCAGMPQTAAATEAGFAPSMGYELVRRPEIVSAIHKEISVLLRTEDAPVARKVLRSIAQDESAPKGVRVDAAKTLLSRAGHVEPRAELAKPDELPMNEMSQEQLRGLVDRLETELAARAKPVSASQSDQAVDIFE